MEIAIWLKDTLQKLFRYPIKSLQITFTYYIRNCPRDMILKQWVKFYDKEYIFVFLRLCREALSSSSSKPLLTYIIVRTGMIYSLGNTFWSDSTFMHLSPSPSAVFPAYNASIWCLSVMMHDWVTLAHTWPREALLAADILLAAHLGRW